ncbi:MAG: DUF6588 family protein, partial [Nitrospiria bacterium]
SWAADNDIVIPSTYTQDQFKDLSETLGLVISYDPLTPAEPLGILGFDIGVEVTAANVDQDASFLKDVIQDPPSYVVFPKLHAQKGLPFGIDVGVVYAKVPDSNIGLIGGELKWAVLKGSVATPAIALRGSYTRLLGVDDIDMSTYGVDLSASKGFGFLTPYIGVGQVWIQSSANVSSPILSDENLSRTKGYVGLKVRLMLLSFVGEAEFSKVPSYTLRANFSF